MCALYVCLYHNGKTREVCGNAAKAAQMEGNDEDNGDVTDEIVPSHKPIPLDDTDHADCNKYAQKSRHAVGARDDQDILIAWCCWVCQMQDAYFKPFQKSFVLMGLTRPTMKADRCLHFL